MVDFIVNSYNTLIDLFIKEPVWQTIWVVAFVFSIYTFMFCKDKRFVFFNMIISIFWWAHFFALWLATAAYIHMVDILKNALALKFEKNKYLTLGFILVYIVISYFKFDWMISLIPLVTAIISTILVFYVRGVYLNIWFLFVIALWMVYNYTGWSVWWLATDITLMVSWVFWVIKIINADKKKQKEKEEKNLETEEKEALEIL
jgi:hypothetical protein